MRLAAQLKAGFYPMSPEIIERVMSKFEANPNATILDPCAGRGDAIYQIAEKFGGCRVVAVELDAGRSESLQQKAKEGDVILPATSFMGCHIPPVFSFIWCNPPFDNELGGGGRIEHLFFQKAYSLLKPEGVLAMVFPSTIWRYEFKRWIEDRLEEVEVIDTRGPFHELVVFGKLRLNRRGTAQNVSTKMNPTIERKIPDSKLSLRSIKKTEPTEFEVAEWAKSVGAIPQTTDRKLSALRSPPKTLGLGHIGLLLPSGRIDGIVRPDNEEPHVVRGTARKLNVLVDERQELSEDEKSVVRTKRMAERIDLVVRVARQDGSIITLGGKEDSDANTQS